MFILFFSQLFSPSNNFRKSFFKKVFTNFRLFCFLEKKKVVIALCSCSVLCIYFNYFWNVNNMYFGCFLNFSVLWSVVSKFLVLERRFFCALSVLFRHNESFLESFAVSTSASGGRYGQLVVSKHLRVL